MLGFDKYLTAKGCVVLKQFRKAEDRCICLVQYPDGSNAVWRCYDRPVPAYEKLVGFTCDEIPEIYRYTATQCGGCLVEEEYVDGISLGELVSDHRLDEAQTAAISRRVCKALAVLHRLNMVHRDVKPENIIVTSKGRVVLIDLDAVSPKNSTKERDTRLLGTVGYAAPEQYGFGHSDGRADIFGVGVLMNVLLTGKHPAQQLADGTLRKVIEKCIAINVDQRYATVEQLMEQLPEGEDKYCPDCGFRSPGGGCIFCGTAVAGVPVRRNRRVWWCLAAVVLMLALVVGVGIGRWKYVSAENPVNETPALVDTEPELSDSIHEQPSPQVSNTPDMPDDLLAQDPDDILMQDTKEQPDKADHQESDIENSDAPEPAKNEETDQPSAEPIHSQEAEKETPSPQATEPNAEGSFPVYTSASVSPLSDFSYDLDDDGIEEKYYFGLLLDAVFPPKFYARDVIRYEQGTDGYTARKVAPAVWKEDQNGNFVLVESFSTLLQDPVISVYEHGETETILAVKATEDLFGCWRGAVEIHYHYGNDDIWVIEARGTLGEAELSASMLAVVTSDVSKRSAQKTILTDGTPIGEALNLAWRTKDELVTGDYTVYDCTAQSLNNGYIRFTVDFIGPQGLNIAVFDPPDGELFLYSVQTASSGEREQIVFDMPEEQVCAAGRFTITFSYKNGSRFMVFFDEIGGA